LERRPATTILKAFSLMWECTDSYAAARMIDTAVDDYATALGGALALGQGASPDAVVRMLRTGVSSTTRLRSSIQDAVDAEVERMEREEAEAANPTPSSNSEPPVSEPPVSDYGNDETIQTSQSDLTGPVSDSYSGSGARPSDQSVSSGV
jgi:hypothetical protein